MTNAKSMGTPSFEDTFSKMSKLKKLKVMQSNILISNKAKSLGINLPKKTIKRGIPMFKYDVDERAEAITQLISQDDRFSKFRPYIMAKTGKPVNKALYAKAKAKVKARVAKWPSAYASGQLVQEYKRMGGKYA